MIRGIYCVLADEVRVKLLHRTHGADALRGAWSASDRWLVNATVAPNTLLLGVESDHDTKRKLKEYMRGDYRISVIQGGLFRERVDEVVDFDLSVEELALGPDFGVYWTMAAGFSPKFKDRILQGLSLDGSLSKCLHDEDIMRDDGPSVVIYRNFFDDETCVRLRRDLWKNLSCEFSDSFGFPLLECGHVTFDGETYNLSSTFRMDR